MIALSARLRTLRRRPRRLLYVALLVAGVLLGSLPSSLGATPSLGHAAAGAGTTAAAAVSAARASLAGGHGPAATPAAPPSVLSPYASAPGTPWNPLYPGAILPSARSTPGLAYSPAAHYVLYFGGGWGGGSSTNDTWTFAGGVWTNISASLSVAPPPREDPMMVYDASDGYILLFGGYTDYGTPNGSYVLNDTWAFSAGTWVNLTSSSSAAPSARFDAAMTYDYNDGYVVLFGGSVLFGAPLGDTWTFHAGVWTDITSTAGTAPAARDFAGFTDDPADGYALLYGGWNASSSSLYADSWSFSAGSWSLLAASGPGPLRGEQMAYDAASSSVLLFGGATDGFGGPFLPLATTWSYSGGVWTNLSSSIASPPPARYLAGITNISTGGAILMADGCLGQGCFPYLDLSDSWVYNRSVSVAQPWTQVATAGIEPSERQSPAMVYDAADGYVLYFGGGWGGGTSAADTWTFANNTWTNITSNLTNHPRFREDPAAAYDAEDGYVVLFGGYTAIGAFGSPSFTLNDTWTYVGGVWTNITNMSSSAPSPRFASVMSYDSHDSEIVLFSGDVLSGPPIADTWTFHAGVWTQVPGGGAAPPARDFSSFADDPTDGYAVLFGGWNVTSSTVYNDTWAFASGAWTLLSTPVAPPPLRGSMLAWEPVGSYLLLFDGLTYSTPGWPFGLTSQTWAFKAGNWTDLDSMITTEPPPRMLAGMAPMGASGEIVMADGCILQGCPYGYDMSDTWIYNWSNINGTFATLAPVVLNTTATFVVQAVGGDGVYTYAYAGLPSGCSSQDTPTLSCVPDYGGNYSVVATVSDASGHALDLAMNVSLPVGGPSLRIALTASSLDVGQSTTFSLTPSGGAGAPWVYAYTGLPSGCASADTATLVCAPLLAGSYVVTATATDVAGGSGASFIDLQVNPRVAVSSTVSATAVDLGETVSLASAATGGSQVYLYAWSGLPQGCTAPTSASLACTPGATGSSTISVAATDSLGESATSMALALTVNADPTVGLSAPSLNAATPLSAGFTALPSGGTGAIAASWNFGDGSAGTGLSVDHTYAAAGTYTVSVTISDARGYTAHASEPVTVVAATTTSPGPIGTPSPSAKPWYESEVGMFGLGLAASLVAILVVALWARGRKRTLDEGAQLVEQIQHPPAAETPEESTDGRRGPG